MLVLFDLDETLIKGDSTMLWLKFCIEKKIISENYLQKAKLYHKDYQDKTLNMQEFVEFFLSSVKNHHQQDIKKLVDEYIEAKIIPIVYKKAKKIIDSFLEQRKIVISATSDFIVAPIANKLGIKESIATTAEIKENKFTGKALGIHSFQEGKVARLKEYLGKDYELLMQESIFYSDSINDLALLERVKTPIVCNGDKALRQIAKERNWQSLNF